MTYERNAPEADVLVVFGITGDPARVMTWCWSARSGRVHRRARRLGQPTGQRLALLNPSMSVQYDIRQGAHQ